MQVVLRLIKPKMFRQQPDVRMLFGPGQYEIGRASKCHVRLTEISVSRQHCLLRVTTDAVFVRDLGSRHKTAVSGQRISDEQLLKDGDYLMIGPYVFVVHISLTDCYDLDPPPEVAGAELGLTIDGGRTA